MPWTESADINTAFHADDGDDGDSMSREVEGLYKSIVGRLHSLEGTRNVIERKHKNLLRMFGFLRTCYSLTSPLKLPACLPASTPQQSNVITTS